MDRAQTLIERLEVAPKGSRALSDDVLSATGHVWHLDFGSAWYSHDGGKTRLYAQHSDVTTSLDAALALAERVLPGCGVRMTKTYNGKGYARINSGIEGEVFAESPALALCIAVLKATTASAVGTQDEVRSEPKTQPTEDNGR